VAVSKAEALKVNLFNRVKADLEELVR